MERKAGLQQCVASFPQVALSRGGRGRARCLWLMPAPGCSPPFPVEDFDNFTTKTIVFTPGGKGAVRWTIEAKLPDKKADDAVNADRKSA